MGHEELLEAKIRALASLQLYAMEQESEARKNLEIVLLDAVISQTREIFINRAIISILAVLVAFSMLDGVPLAATIFVAFAFLLYGGFVAVKEAKALHSALGSIEIARIDCERAKFNAMSFSSEI